jgi:hypothetical protein
MLHNVQEAVFVVSLQIPDYTRRRPPRLSRSDALHFKTDDAIAESFKQSVELSLRKNRVVTAITEKHREAISITVVWLSPDGDSIRPPCCRLPDEPTRSEKL